MVGSLSTKLLRDLWHLRGQLVAAALVVACGVACFVALRSAYDSLLGTRTSYYDAYRFGDVFATVKRAPESLLESVRSIDGVSSVRSRIVVGVSVDVPGLDEPAGGLMISMPDRRDPVLNDIAVMEGRYLEPGRLDEVIVSDAFAEANSLVPGDRIAAVINGARQQFTIVGVALSPEFVYEIGPGAILPDARRFGVMWTTRDALAGPFAMEGAFNDLVLTLARGADEPEVIARLDKVLEPYGTLGAYGRDRQNSDVFLTSELQQLRTTGSAVPLIFLGVAAFLLHIVLSRLVRTQRDQIAVLKAFGYTNRTIGLHYLGMAMSAIMIGAILGILFGMWTGSMMTDMYAQFYRFPLIRYTAAPSTIGVGVLIAGGAALVGALSAVRSAVKLPPAEAMRPEAPPTFRAGIIERLGLGSSMPTAVRMIIRSLERNPVKAALSVVGIAMAVAILIVGRYSGDAVDVLIANQFEGAQREDVTVAFNETLPASALYSLAARPGVEAVEPFRTAPVRLASGNRDRQLVLSGVPRNARLRMITDMEGTRYAPPTGGLLMTRELGALLGVMPGDSVRAEFLEGRRPVRTLPVEGFIDEFVGLNAYVDIDVLRTMLGERGTANGAYVMIEDGGEEEFNRSIKGVPAIGGTMFRKAALESFEKTIAESQSISRFIMIFFACVIAIGVLYNSARISLSERGRELASLRVLGFRKGEVALYLLGEQALLVLLALPVGYCIGWLLVLALVEGFASDLFRFPLVISPQTLAFATIVVLLAAAGSALLVRRRIFSLDLIEVLKTRE